ncbi:hypothetical protein FPQ18DRAFT_329346 [Pyronema domesticum]|nr:hypothetical protein FPQ18DRAFT_329346 [Pyronema domesticum]
MKHFLSFAKPLLVLFRVLPTASCDLGPSHVWYAWIGTPVQPSKRSRRQRETQFHLQHQKPLCRQPVTHPG